MCGFVGILNRLGQAMDINTESILQHMSAQIGHRGPDDSTAFTDGPFAGVFNRLSIIDVAGANQPFVSEDNQIMLMINGEIYNHVALKSQLNHPHQFRTASDGEVLLHLYEEIGIDALSHINGMFAVAIWDRRINRLYLARDRMGIKPLYYTTFNQQLAFGSEIKALLAHPDCPRQFDWFEALSGRRSHLISQQTLPSCFKDIHYLPAGSYLAVDLNFTELTPQTWWHYPDHDYSNETFAQDTRSENEIIEGYRELLDKAVNRRLMSDVGVGLMLSGGIDSVAIAALAAKQSGGIKASELETFSAFSQSTFENGDAKAGAQAAKMLGLVNHQVNFSWHDNPFTAKDWQSLVWLLETPDINAEHIYKYHLHRYARHSSPNLKVMLLGQGSDELNGGYSHNYLKRLRPELPAEQWSWPELMGLMEDIERQHLLRGKMSQVEHYGSLIESSYLASLLTSQGGARLSKHPWQTYNRINRLNLQMYNLWHEDRTAAGNGIESRVPFLDHQLVEFCAAIPPKHYQNLFWDKRILREAMKPYLPAEFYQRPKVPFFEGKDLRYTQRMMYNLLIEDDYALLHQAFGDSRHSVIDTKELNRLIDSIPEDPEYQGVDSLLRLTNMGLLANMANQIPKPHQQQTAAMPVLQTIKTDDWQKQNQKLTESLAIRRAELPLDAPVALADNVRLYSDTGQMNPTSYLYIAINSQIEYEIDPNDTPNWAAAIQMIDGKRSINDIAKALNISHASIRKDIEEALDYDLLKFN